MVKKRLIDVLVNEIETKLDTNGALRNVEVSDAWKRMRQKIEVQAWKDATGIAEELSVGLKKINMLKAVSVQITKLTQTFQHPDEMVEDNDLHKPTKEKNINSETVKLNEDIVKLKINLEQVRDTLEKNNNVPDTVDIPSGVNDQIQSCYKSLLFICDRCKKNTRDLEHHKKRIDNCETRNKDLEKQIDEKEESLNKLTATVDTLQKKHSNFKSEKMDGFKEQMKLKSLERQVELKETEMTKLKEENKDLKERLTAITEVSDKDVADVLNPFPPAKVAEKFTDIYNKEWKDAFAFYKTSLGKSDKDAALRLLDILQDSYKFCEEKSEGQTKGIIAELSCSGTADSTNKTSFSKAIDDSEMRQLSNLRKKTCLKSSEFVKTAFITKLEASNEEKYSLQEITDAMPYIEKCVEICWIMLTQTPPLYIELGTSVKTNDNIDKTMFDISLGKGSKMDHITWPPLLSCKGGHVVKTGFVKAK